MIKSTELRIGNIVIWNPQLVNPSNTLPSMQLEVASVHANKIGYISPSFEHRVEPFEDDKIFNETGTKTLEELEPLAISDDILEKLAFKKSLGKWKKKVEIEGEKYSFEMNGKGKWLFEGTELPNPPQNFHQLQNIFFYLTGHELDINL